MVIKKRFLYQMISWVTCICMIAGLTIGFPNTVYANDSVTVISTSKANDIATHWAESHIGPWLDKGLINGFPDGTFGPDKAITRAEFMALVNRAYGFYEKSNISFTDVESVDWFYDEVAKAVVAGYITGYEDGSVKPNGLISRQEAAMILSRLMKLATHENTNGIAKFSDYSSMPDWSKDAINSVVAEGYMLGNTNGAFMPVAAITRAETVVTLSRAAGEIYHQLGTYDEDKTIPGNATINTTGVTLENVVIEGNLYLTPGIGEGTVVLRNVTVKGIVVVDGGGDGEVVFEDCDIQEIVGSVEPIIVTSSVQPPSGGGSGTGGGGGGTQPPTTTYTLLLIGADISSSIPAGDVSENTVVTITLTPAVGKEIATFTVNGDDKKPQLVANQYIFTITENTTISVTYQDIPTTQKSVYDILFDPTGLVAGEGKDVDITLRAIEVKDEGYDKVRINVELTDKPVDSTASLIGNYGAGPVNVIELGYWGPAEGHAVSKNYDSTYTLIALFSEPGQYTIKITLRDLDENTDILTKTVVITVAAAPEYPLFIDTSPQDNPRITNPHDDGFTVYAYLDRPGNIYVIVVEKDKPAPSSSQVREGGALYLSTNTDPVDMVEIKAYGSVQIPDIAEPGGVIFKTLLPDTEYDIYVVTEEMDNSANLQPIPLKITHRTNVLYTGTQINAANGYPKIEHLTNTSIKITFRTNRRATIHYLISTSSSVNTSSILSGQYIVNGWHHYKASGVIGTIREQERSVVVEGLDSGMEYYLYAVYANPDNNLYDDSASSRNSFITSGNKYPPVINYEIINISDDGFTIRRIFDISNYIREYYLVVEEGSTAPSYDYLKSNGVEIQPTTSPTDTLIDGLDPGTRYIVYTATYWSDDPDTHTTVPHMLEAITLSQ